VIECGDFVAFAAHPMGIFNPRATTAKALKSAKPNSIRRQGRIDERGEIS